MRTVLNVAPGKQTVIALEDGALITGTLQDCTAIREDAMARHNAGLHGSADIKHAARLPDWAVERYCHLHGITFAEFMGNREHVRRMCNDPTLRDFRIWPGKV